MPRRLPIGDSFLLAFVGLSAVGFQAIIDTDTRSVPSGQSWSNFSKVEVAAGRSTSSARHKMLALKTLLLTASLATLASSSAIPIWELLTRQEKMGRLMYVFIHLVEQYCKESTIPDCQKVLTLYGLSHLVTEEEEALDLMDPYQSNGRLIIWHKVMKGSFKMPSSKIFFPEDSLADEDYDLANQVEDGPSPPSSPDHLKGFNDPHPYSVRVPAPADAQAFRRQPQAVRGATTQARPPSGIKASADFEPTTSESRTSVSAAVRRLPPNPRLVRSRRAFDVFPEEEMKDLLSRIFRK